MTIRLSSPPDVIVVWEQEPNWQPELQRAFPQYDVRSGSPSICASDPPPSLVLIDDRCTVASDSPLTKWLQSRSLRDIPTVLIASSISTTMEWELRDCGIDSVLDGRTPRVDVLHSCRRLLRPERGALSDQP